MKLFILTTRPNFITSSVFEPRGRRGGVTRAMAKRPSTTFFIYFLFWLGMAAWRGLLDISQCKIKFTLTLCTARMLPTSDERALLSAPLCDWLVWQHCKQRYDTVIDPGYCPALTNLSCPPLLSLYNRGQRILNSCVTFWILPENKIPRAPGA